jgi:trimeric autotransporter adhesin
MRHYYSRSAVAVLAMAALSGSAALAADEQPPRPAPGTLLIVAGTGPKGFSGDGGPASQALLNGPLGVAFDAAGNLFIAEEGNIDDDDHGRVRRMTPGNIISTLAGGGKTQPGLVNGIPGAEARIIDANFLASDGVGNLFIAGFYANRVWKVTPDGLITTLQQFRGPTGLAVDGGGNLFIGDYFNNRVRKVTPDGMITTVAGGGRKPPETADGGPATQARLSAPFGLAVDAAGNLFIVDGGNHRVRKMSTDGIITTVAGNGTAGSSGDGGLATEAQLNGPFGVAVDSVGNLFIADRDDYRVRKVTPDGIITTVAGTGKGEFSDVGGLATSAGLRGPHGLAVDAAGNLFIADTDWWDEHEQRAGQPNEHVLKVVGVAAPGLIAGKPFPKQ